MAIGELLSKARHQAVDPEQQKSGETLVRVLHQMADKEQQEGDTFLAGEILRIAGEVDAVNYLAKLPEEVRVNYEMAFGDKSTHEQSTNLN